MSVNTSAPVSRSRPIAATSIEANSARVTGFFGEKVPAAVPFSRNLSARLWIWLFAQEEPVSLKLISLVAAAYVDKPGRLILTKVEPSVSCLNFAGTG
ncbi:hypothetical protein D3C73_1411620 [compost metagenome]